MPTLVDPTADLSHIAPDLHRLAVRVDSLTSDPMNARLHPEQNTAAIMESLRRYGQLKPIVVRRQGRVVIAGNGTLAAAKALHWTWIAASMNDMTDVQATGYGLADNRTAELAQWDTVRMGRCEALMREWGESPVGFDDDAVACMRMADMEKTWNPQADPEANGESACDDLTRLSAPERCTLGDVWLINGGRHRLVVGDATDPQAMTLAALPAEIAVVITDPPYGINLENHAPGKERSKRSFRVVGDHSQDVGSIVLALCKEAELPIVAFANPKLPWPGEWKQHLVWDKGGAVGGGGDMATYWKNTWELIQVRGTGELNGPRDNAVLTFHVTGAHFDLHPTQKPMLLLAYLIEKTTHLGEVVYDPFLGSGTTIIAAQRTGRRCFGCEIDPRLGDVILARCEQEGMTVAKEGLPALTDAV